MGYHTEFIGHVTVTPPLNEHEVTYLKRFAQSRRYQRVSGPYRTDTDEYRGPDTIDYNRETEGQPSLWCDWEPSDDGATISWNGMEKFHDADRWMSYLIDTFLKPSARVLYELDAPVEGRYYVPEFDHFAFDHVVNGTIDAQGDDPDDRWQLVVVDNEVWVHRLPTFAERAAADPELAAAVEKLRAEGVTPMQFADLTGQDY